MEKITYLTPNVKEEAYKTSTAIPVDSGCESPTIRLLEDWKVPYISTKLLISEYIRIQIYVFIQEKKIKDTLFAPTSHQDVKNLSLHECNEK